MGRDRARIKGRGRDRARIRGRGRARARARASRPAVRAASPRA